MNFRFRKYRENKFIYVIFLSMHNISQIPIEKKVNDLDIETASQEDLMECALYILKTPKDQRSEHDINILQKYTRNIEFFHNIITQQENGDDLHAELCRNLEIESLPADRILFHAGSVGTTFYIILKGRVDVRINIATKDALDEKKFITKSVAELPAGKAFGELAIMDESVKPRKATIVTKEDSVFATLSRVAFRASLGYMKKEMENLMDFFQGNPVFSLNHWSNRALIHMIKSFHQMRGIHRSTVIYKEGDPCEEVYLIRSGQVVQTKTVTLPEETNLRKLLILDEKNKMYHLEKEPIVKNVEISYMGESQLFGEEESYLLFKQEMMLEKEKERLKKEFKKLFEAERYRKFREGQSYKANKELNVPFDPRDDPAEIEELVKKKLAKMVPHKIVRQTTVMVTSSKADIWCLSKKDFFAYMSGNQMALDILLGMIEVKNERRNQRIQSIQRSAVDNLEYVSKHALSMLNKDIQTLVKKKQNEKREASFSPGKNVKHERAYQSIVQAIKNVKETRLLRQERLQQHRGTMVGTESIINLHPTNVAFSFPMDKMLQHTGDETIQRIVGKIAEEGLRERSPTIIKERDGSPGRLSTLTGLSPIEDRRRATTLFLPPLKLPEPKIRRVTQDVMKTAKISTEGEMTKPNVFSSVPSSPIKNDQKAATGLSPADKKIYQNLLSQIQNPDVKEYIAQNSEVLGEAAMFEVLKAIPGLEKNETTSSETGPIEDNDPNAASRVTNKKKKVEIEASQVAAQKQLKMKFDLTRRMSRGIDIKADFKNPLFSVSELKQYHDLITRAVAEMQNPGLVLMMMNDSARVKKHKPQKDRSNVFLTEKRSSNMPSARSTSDRNLLERLRSERANQSFVEGLTPKLNRSASGESSKSLNSSLLINRKASSNMPPLPVDSKDESPMTTNRLSKFSPRRGALMVPKTEIKLPDSLELAQQAVKDFVPGKQILKSILNDHKKEREKLESAKEATKRCFLSSFALPATDTSGDMLLGPQNKSFIIELDPDHSNRIANLISSRKETTVPHIPKFTSRHRALSKNENSVYNRSAKVDKAKILANRIQVAQIKTKSQLTDDEKLSGW